MIYDAYRFQVPPSKQIRVIVDSDAKNEADDPFAIVHALLSPRLENVGVIAAHFGEKRSPTSMEDSYQEIQTLLGLMALSDALAFRGAAHAMTEGDEPVRSEGAELIVREAMREDPRPLFVLFLGPLTDMASALLMEPAIAGRMTCVWIGGGPYPNGGFEYNLQNDLIAARVVMGSSMPVWQIPRDVYSRVVVSLAELELRVEPCGELGRHLFDQLNQTMQTPASLATNRTGEFWCLGDSPAVGVLLSAHMFDSEWLPAPDILDTLHYAPNPLNRPIRVFRRVDERFVLEDLFAKLALFARRVKE